MPLRRLHPGPGETRDHVHDSNQSIAARAPRFPILGRARRCVESVAGWWRTRCNQPLLRDSARTDAKRAACQRDLSSA